jgi:hypothetical protein
VVSNVRGGRRQLEGPSPRRCVLAIEPKPVRQAEKGLNI